MATVVDVSQRERALSNLRQSLRYLLHSAVLGCGFRLVRASPFERAIRRWELTHDDFYFVQIGAHNGVTSDPFQRFIVEGLWTCVLVEPQPESFQILQTIYCDRDKVHCINAAIGPEEGTLRLYQIRDSVEGLPYWANQLASTRREVIASHADRIPQIDQYIEEVEMPCRTLASVCLDQHLPRIDLLAIDVEGYDYEVVRHIDQLPYRPKFIYYEHLHLSVDDYQASLKFLQSRGYRTQSVNNGDTFAIYQR